jgi:putative exporter of polyketide antibiotics
MNWSVLWEFAVHTVIGSLIFGFVALPAVFLDYGLHELESRFKTDEFVVWGLVWAARLLLAIDLFLFAVFLIKTARRMIPKL